MSFWCHRYDKKKLIFIISFRWNFHLFMIYIKKKIKKISINQEICDADPLTLAQIHEHLVRSPPPASWTRNPVFHFPHDQSQNSPGSKSESDARYGTVSPKSGSTLNQSDNHYYDHQLKNEDSLENRGENWKILTKGENWLFAWIIFKSNFRAKKRSV